jgi:FkbM family methyltransferase
VVVEAGANIGSHTLAISEFVGDEGAVYAFEPQGAVFQILCANMALNSRLNVKCYCEAVGENPAHTLVRRLNFRVENNFGGLSVGGDLPGDLVPVVTVDSLQLPRCNLLKADVEGGELGVIKGAAETIKKYHPALYIESPLATRENDRKERSAALIAHIMSLDYDLYWHAPLMFNPKNFYGNPSNVFARIISLNMLCVHRSVPSKIQGLRRIDGPESNWWRA